jgi:hypothetical protein
VIQGMQIDCPPGWRDKSMLILSAGQAGASGVTPNIVVTREQLPPDLPKPPDQRMNMLLDRQVDQMRNQLAGFVEVSRRLNVDAGHPSAELKVDWTSVQAALTQSVTFVDAGDDGLMVATATAGRGEFAESEPVFREMLKSFRLG